jgi:hypothetical protein
MIDPFLLAIEIGNDVELELGVQLADVQPLDVDTESVRVAAGELNYPLLGLFPLTTENCFEEWRRETDEVLVDAEVVVFGLSTNADYDDLGTHPAVVSMASHRGSHHLLQQRSIKESRHKYTVGRR